MSSRSEADAVRSTGVARHRRWGVVFVLATVFAPVPTMAQGGGTPADSQYQRQLDEYNRSLRDYERRRSEFERERGEYEEKLKAFQSESARQQAAEAGRLAAIATSHQQYRASLVEYLQRLDASEAEARTPVRNRPPQTELIAEIGQRRATLRTEAERFHLQLVNEGRQAQGRGDDATARLRFDLANALAADFGMVSAGARDGATESPFNPDDPSIPEAMRVGVRLLQTGSFYLASVSFGEQLRSAGGNDRRATLLRDLAGYLDGWQKRLSGADPASRRDTCLEFERDVSRRWPEGRHATTAGVAVDLELLRKHCV